MRSVIITMCVHVNTLFIRKSLKTEGGVTVPAVWPPVKKTSAPSSHRSWKHSHLIGRSELVGAPTSAQSLSVQQRDNWRWWIYEILRGGEINLSIYSCIYSFSDNSASFISWWRFLELINGPWGEIIFQLFFAASLCFYWTVNVSQPRCRTTVHLFFMVLLKR